MYSLPHNGMERVSREAIYVFNFSGLHVNNLNCSKLNLLKYLLADFTDSPH